MANRKRNCSVSMALRFSEIAIRLGEVIFGSSQLKLNGKISELFRWSMKVDRYSNFVGPNRTDCSELTNVSLDREGSD